MRRRKSRGNAEDRDVVSYVGVQCQIESGFKFASSEQSSIIIPTYPILSSSIETS